MLKEQEGAIHFFHIASDLIITALAYLLAWYLRFELQIIPITKGKPDFIPYMFLLLPMISIWAIIFYSSGLYISRRTRPLYEEFTVIMIDVTLAMLCLLTFLFFYREFSYSSLTMGIFYVLDLAGLGLFRIGLRHILHEIRKKGFNLRYILIIGVGEKAWDLTKTIMNHPEYGLKIIGYLREKPKIPPYHSFIDKHLLGEIDSLPLIVNKRSIDIAMITLPHQEITAITKAIDYLIEKSIQIKVVPDSWQLILRNSVIEDFNGKALLNIGVKPIIGVQAIMKRSMDIALSIVLLLIFGLPMLLVGLCIKLFSPGPCCYYQERIGLDGKTFRIIKFRTMANNAEKKTGPIMVGAEPDMRCFRFGALLRKSGMDELPQLFNVLKGDMSLVGPRPERPFFAKKFKDQIPRYLERHRVKCGITGWAQINGLRGGDTPIDKRLEYDLFYIENWSLLLDIEILIGTLFFAWRNAK